MRNFVKKNIAKTIISTLLVISMLVPNVNFFGTEVKAADSYEKQIWDFFKAKGYSDAGIAGIMGNIYMESTYKPYRLANSSVTYAGYKDQGQTFTSQVDNFDLTYEDFVACAKFTMYESDWRQLEASGVNLNSTSYQYGYGLCMWYHYSLKRALYNYWKKNYWTQVEGVNENGEPVMKNQAVKSIGDMEVQLNFLYDDMLTAKSNIIDKKVYNLKTELTKKTNPFYTANLFHDCYEKSGRAYFYKRINEAIRVYNYYSDANSIIKLTTNAATDITDTSAGISAKYSNPSGMNITKVAIKYGTDAGSMTSEQTFSANTSNASGTLSTRTIDGLKPGTKYFYCPMVFVGEQAYCGEIKWFTTTGTPEAPAPEPAPEPTPETNPGLGVSNEFVLFTADAKNITETSATFYADYLNPNAINVTKTGYLIGTSEADMKEANGSPYTANIVNTSGTLKDRTITGLNPGTTYYFRSYAVSSSNIYYGNTKSFTTLGKKGEAIDTHVHSGTYVNFKKATATANGTLAHYKCSCGKMFTDAECTNETNNVVINMASTIKLEKASFTYDGKAKDPKVIITDVNGNAISTSYYTVAKASGRVNVGAYTYKITFKGRYSGSKSLTFKINPKGTTQGTPVGAKKAFTVKWTKQATAMKKSRITGYQVQYSRNANFSDNTATKAIGGYSKTSVKITNVTAKKYYVRVRTYMNVNGVNYYSPWSAVKTVNIK